MKKQRPKSKKIVNYSSREVSRLTDHTNYKKLDKIKNKDIDYSDIPDTDKNMWADAKVVDAKKKAISLRVDNDVLVWFKSQDGRYQKLMNKVLRKYMDSHAK